MNNIMQLIQSDVFVLLVSCFGFACVLAYVLQAIDKFVNELIYGK